MLHSVITLSLLPWDAGKPIPRSASQELEKVIFGLGFQRQRQRIGQEEVILYRIPLRNYKLFLRVFSDGTAQFLLLSQRTNYRSSKDIDPDALNQRKWLLHKELMSANPKWDLLRNVAKAIRTFVRGIYDNQPIRSSADESWEATGFSYVFTAFLIRAQRREVNDEMLSILLAPKRQDISESTANYEDTAHSSTRVTNKEIAQLCLADMPAFCAWYGWASSVCTYSKSGRYLHRYLAMLSGTHRTWFRFYLLSRHLDTLSPKIARRMPTSDIERLNLELNDVHREAFSLKNLNRSMVSELDLAAESIVWEKSRLSNIYDDICEKGDLLRRELEGALERRSSSRLRYLEVILITLTLIQAASAYVAVRESESLSTAEMALFVTLGLVALTIIFWRR